jgi:cobalt transporter subunit CbtB
MSATNETVRGRVKGVLIELTPAQLALGLGLAALLAIGLVFAQDPVVHEALHDFRHTGGITCH